MKRRFDPTQARQVPPAIASWVLGPGGVRWHLRALAGAAALLVLVNIAVDPDRLWSLPVIGVWAFVLAVHAAIAGTASTWLAGAAPVLSATARTARRRLPTRELVAPTDPAAAAHSGDRAPIPATPTDRRLEIPTPARHVAVARSFLANRAALSAPGGSAEPADRGVGSEPNRSAVPGFGPGTVQPLVDHAPSAAARHPNGTLPDAVVALWGPSVPAAAPTIVERYASWRWGPPAAAPAAGPSSFAPMAAEAQPPPEPAERDVRPVPASNPDETVPLALLAADATPDSSLAGD